MLLALACVPAADGQTVDVTAATIEDLNRAFNAGTLTLEQLVEGYLARIAAYDDAGPALNAVIALNPNAVARARELDAERRSGGPRSPLHGIPVVLKDNFDTADLPTTAGSALLEGSLPPDDGFLVRKLREAGAIVLAKVNMSEFASGGRSARWGGDARATPTTSSVRRADRRGDRRGDRGGLRPGRAGDRHRRIGALAVDRQRHRGAQAHPGPAEPRRHRAPRTVTTGLMIEAKETDDAMEGGVGRRPWVGKGRREDGRCQARAQRQQANTEPSRMWDETMGGVRRRSVRCLKSSVCRELSAVTEGQEILRATMADRCRFDTGNSQSRRLDQSRQRTITAGERGAATAAVAFGRRWYTRYTRQPDHVASVAHKE